MQDYSNIIRINLKRTRICYTIGLIVWAVSFLIFLMRDIWIIQTKGISISETNLVDPKWWLVLLFITLSFINGITAEKWYFPSPKESIRLKQFMTRREFSSPHESRLIRLRGAFISSNPFLVSVVIVFFSRQYGSYGLAGIPVLIGHIYFIIAFHNALKQYKESPEYISKMKEREEEKTKRLQLKNEEEAKRLLAKAGKVFFVKYYYQLKKQNEIDIIDCIQENYDKESKRNRIASAKSIFSNNLETEALNIILKNEDEVANSETLDIAKSILEEETKNNIKPSDKETNESKEQIPQNQ